MRKHEAAVELKCECCTKRCESIDDFNSHILACSHSDFTTDVLKIDSELKSMKKLSNVLIGKLVNKIYACKNCYAVFETEGSLKSHKEICTALYVNNYWNEESKKYTCPFCSNSLRTRHVVWFAGHMKECHMEDKKVYKKKLKAAFSCVQCDKQFQVKSSFKTHQKVHTSERPFKCTLCTKTYKINGQLLEHKITHTDSYNFSCDICAKQFKLKKALRMHMATHLDESEKKHVCTECGYKFGRLAHLKNHLHTHSLGPNFFCEECGAGFKTKEQCRQHSKKHHGEK